MISNFLSRLFLSASGFAAAAMLIAAPVSIVSQSPSTGDKAEIPRFAGSGFYRVEQRDGRWWIVVPDGGAFYSIGINHIHPAGDDAPDLGYSPYNRNLMAKRGSVEAWAKLAEERLLGWVFNSIGAWSSDDYTMPRFEILGFASHSNGRLEDFFAPRFAEAAEKEAENRVRPDDANVIGYFLDNELPWNTDWRQGPSLFDAYVELQADAPGKQELVEYMRQKYGGVDAFNAVWSPDISSWEELAGAAKLEAKKEPEARAGREAFTLEIARQYFRIATGAIRRRDPNHMIFGSRFVSWTAPAAVIKAAGEYCDVVSINHYELGPLGLQLFKGMSTPVEIPGGFDPTFKKFYELAKRPLLISEFGFRAMDSGLPNTYPPPSLVQPTVPDQAARARRYEKYASLWAGSAWFIGHHWFEYADEPKEGRFDGENGNYGLVNIEDEPYDVFVGAVSKVNVGILKTHALAGGGF